MLRVPIFSPVDYTACAIKAHGGAGHQLSPNVLFHQGGSTIMIGVDHGTVLRLNLANLIRGQLQTFQMAAVISDQKMAGPAP